MFAAEFEQVEPARRRSAPRGPLSLETRLDDGRLGRAVCKVLDLSTTGARLQTYSALTRGAMIALILPGIGDIAAEVMWSNDFLAGCQFRRPIAQAAVDTLIGDR